MTDNRPQMLKRMCYKLPIAGLLLMSGVAFTAPKQPDAIIIGAGIAGLSAALEAARSGAQVLVVDMSTVGGGHAILSNGAVCMVATPLQGKNQVVDSPELAEQDFLTRGEDANPEWVSAYVRNSKTWLYDWLSATGVVFEALVKPAGNSVPRLHLARGKGWGLVGPLFRECLRHPNISFLWASKAEKLIVEAGSVRGVTTRDLRGGRPRDYRAHNVIVATGGFQNNLDLVLRNWPPDLPKPTRLLAGAAHTATGSGHELLQRAGGLLIRMDHQWNYVLGLPDPRDPQGVRGLAAFNFNSIWVNAEGRRFTQEFGDPKIALNALLRQPRATYWSVFDENGKRGFSVTLAGWENFNEVSKLVYDTEAVTLKADSIDELAIKMKVPKEGLRATIERYNHLTAEGVDHDFQAFGAKTTPKPKKIETAPFYAAQFFPITRKSMGGVSVDPQCRVLDSQDKPIHGLYAVGEVTGFGGINGRAALEGTFLGPSSFMGRIAGKAVGKSPGPKPVVLRGVSAPNAERPFDNQQCLRCHPLAQDISKNHPGYWHYEQSHAKVISRSYNCSRCHSDLYPYQKARHRMNQLALTHQCGACHGVQSVSSPVP